LISIAKIKQKNENYNIFGFFINKKKQKSGEKTFKTELYLTNRPIYSKK